ncbi:MAG: hypothetical protein M0Z94_04390 [Dehalococcoidales bacterium]|nr:hypothetical protein [Dehalococcoidales bacterium]
MADELGSRYGEGVTVEYVDIFSPVMFESHLDVLRLISTRGLALPLVSIAGRPRFAGGISTPMICKLLDKMGAQLVNGA